jgi:hypothetical protein
MEVFCSIPSRSLLSPSYYHSFGLTENYIVFLEQPFKLDILKMATAYMRGVSWASCMTFHREDKVRPGWAVHSTTGAQVRGTSPQRKLPRRKEGASYHTSPWRQPPTFQKVLKLGCPLEWFQES